MTCHKCGRCGAMTKGEQPVVTVACLKTQVWCKEENSPQNNVDKNAPRDTIPS